jgi:hypothetical protein
LPYGGIITFCNRFTNMPYNIGLNGSIAEANITVIQGMDMKIC